LRSLWRWRRLVARLARREFRARYAGSALGAAWAILEPAVHFGLYLAVFGYFLGMRLESRPDVTSFGFYLVSGLVPFLAFQESLVQAAHLARANAGLIRHVNVPLEVLLAASVLAIFSRHLVGLAVILVAATAAGVLSLPHLPVLLLGGLVLLVGTLGATLALMPASAFLPDLAHVVGTATTVLFFLTPIVYPQSLLPAVLQRWLPLNPLHGVVAAFRRGVMAAPAQPVALAVAAALAVLALVVGSWLFNLRSAAVRDLV
jgi:lipopolysaccharide transport system permease protein